MLFTLLLIEMVIDVDHVFPCPDFCGSDMVHVASGARKT